MGPCNSGQWARRPIDSLWFVMTGPSSCFGLVGLLRASVGLVDKSPVGENMGHAAIDGVPDAGLGLIGNGDHGLAPIGLGHVVQQQLGHVAGPKHLVDGRKSGRALLRTEIRPEYAVWGALPPEELACAARRPSPG
ncbi:PRA1 family protein 2 [Striga asiatica]|uniref:PRA1 family protein 2 n=1 Tax=Striga asiatica TaxID=4170 RepID=A0A5A7RKV4_STRAF|nr:PRA1 family protein 2 [Striga asiatica]